MLHAAAPQPLDVRTTAADYADLYAKLGWRIAPGTYRDAAGSCSCGLSNCDRPGLHPADPGWGEQATTRPQTLNGWLTDAPGCLVTPVGECFDVIAISAPAGHRLLAALEHADIVLGPVLRTPGALHVFTAVASPIPALPFGAIWLPTDGYAVLPVGGPEPQAVQWLVPPTPVNAQALPEPAAVATHLTRSCDQFPSRCKEAP
ncbi:bifunctional DNA primase/polymerase [Yinghuangia sp. ASG 101]|uniref:bifunctional DNA primase/polymerase n=1 Tax=Yinghuangia sp. ASG 101 TaxID=2896848 RepID=UPI001E382451|nr:bifunctional DNA primase/polymerase [Yinghuangia sp. ASG 101]UGQ10977.1 bifunctional DNA primase/polymerase [Yinghuangia sp. ASG 101]